MKKAFSMVTAIFIIILMSTVAVFIMNLSGKMVKGTTVQFQKEQSMLLAKSYTEYAIMAVTANDHTGDNCLKKITGNYGGYTIDVSISYIGNNLDTSCNPNKLNDTDIDTDKSPLNIIVDVFVSYPDLDHPDNLNMTYHRRSLQKI